MNKNFLLINGKMGIGDWGLGIGDWGLGGGANPQSPFFFIKNLFIYNIYIFLKLIDN